MADEPTRFLLGYGERLTERVGPPPGGGGPTPPYEPLEAVARLAPMLRSTSQALARLPDTACPDGEAVSVVTLHPQAIAKSYHPRQLLDVYNLRQVGSRPTEVVPEKWTRKSEPSEAPATDLYVAGTRDAFARWSADLETLAPSLTATAFTQLQRIESVRAPSTNERYRPGPRAGETAGSEILLEVVLHANNLPESEEILAAFEAYAISVDARADLDRRLFAGNLCFLPVDAQPESLDELLRFSFLRVARPMPRLRRTFPIERAQPMSNSAPCPLPDEDAVDADLRVAIFDGGLSAGSGLDRWADSITPQGVGELVDDLAGHGHNVTSAFLFGSLTPGSPARRPFARAEVFQVLDDKTDSDPYELYDVLRRIQNVLRERNHRYFNLSLGPSWPVEDDEVHSWTAVLDEHLSNGECVATIAVGNNGEEQPPSEARIQIPADSVNAMSVGAADSTRAGWNRAPYSALGPGRSPGRVKPDVVHFGGDAREPFVVYDVEHPPNVASTAGTSFSAPATLRAAVGVRAHFGERISPLASKALVIHSADAGDRDRTEVGWGAVSSDIEDLVVCRDGGVRILYQGELNPAQYLRALVPLPQDQLQGLITVTASFCYATPTDPQDPGTYTRSGLEVTFRPHAAKFREGATEPTTKPFFRKSDYDSEQELRNDAQKWETAMRASRTFQGKSLFRPVFDIHYNAREAGGPTTGGAPMKYALVVSVESARNLDLYDIVSREYAGQLEPIQPRYEIKVRT